MEIAAPVVTFFAVIINLPASAAVVVSNLSNGDASGWDLGPASGLESVANSFTTGSEAGWIVNSATLNLVPDLVDPVVPDQAVTLTIAADSSGAPGATVGSFATSPPTIPGNSTWAAAGTINLSPNTTYWLVASYAIEEVVYWTNTADLTSSGEPGWSIGDDALTLNGSTWEVLISDQPVLFELDASVVPEPGTSSLLLFTGLALLRRKRR